MGNPPKRSASITDSDSSDHDHEAELNRSFRNLGLGKNNGFIDSIAGASSSSSSSLNCFLARTRKQEADTSDIEFNRRLGKSPMTAMMADEDNRGYGHQTSNNRGDTSRPNMHSASGNYTGSMNQYNSNYYPNNFAGNFASSSSCYGGPSMPNSVNQFGRNSTNLYQGMGSYGLNSNPELYGMGRIHPTNRYEPRATRTNGYCSGNEYYSPNSCGQYPEIFLQTCNVAMLAMDESGSNRLKELLQKGNPSVTRIVCDKVVESPFELMINVYGHKVFQSLVNRCDYSQLKSVVEKITSNIPSFVNAAVSRFGSYSLQSLIRKVEKLDLARLVTQAVSAELYYLTTHFRGRHVVEQCLNCLDRKANEVLYETAVAHWFKLAKDPGGCISLCHCIDSIEGDRRDCLLKSICQESAELSIHPSGTFVVQYVLELADKNLSSMICRNLQGSYVRLSRLKHGSFLVEKCMGASKWGLDCFVKDIEKDRSMLEKLAQHQFGNFVVKKALEISAQEVHRTNREILVRALQSLEPEKLEKLEKSPYGIHVVRAMRGLTSSESEFDPRRSQC